MACARHNLRMLGLAVRGRIHAPEHAALLAEVRRCRRCSPGSSGSRPPALPPPDAPRVPRVRVEQSVRELVAALRQ